MADETKTVEPENLPVEETPEAEGTDEEKEEGIDKL